mmetsp:Transcript_44424/g.99449  ORF Transcript_44424/g.99449 Transcript_44424/m.99449 type:complete len:217 (-) Transcript_44424:161-811(-)
MAKATDEPIHCCGASRPRTAWRSRPICSKAPRAACCACSSAPRPKVETSSQASRNSAARNRCRVNRRITLGEMYLAVADMLLACRTSATLRSRTDGGSSMPSRRNPSTAELVRWSTQAFFQALRRLLPFQQATDVSAPSFTSRSLIWSKPCRKFSSSNSSRPGRGLLGDSMGDSSFSFFAFSLARHSRRTMPGQDIALRPKAAQEGLAFTASRSLA